MAFRTSVVLNYLLSGVLLIGGILAAFLARRYRKEKVLSSEDVGVEMLTRQFEYYLAGSVVILFGFVVYTAGASANMSNLFDFATGLGVLYVGIFVVTIGQQVFSTW